MIIQGERVESYRGSEWIIQGERVENLSLKIKTILLQLFFWFPRSEGRIGV